jgi:hypothetical protein
MTRDAWCAGDEWEVVHGGAWCGGDREGNDAGALEVGGEVGGLARPDWVVTAGWQQGQN